MILIILVSGALGTSIPEERKKTLSCQSDNEDMTNAVYFMTALTVAIALVFIVFFRPKYLRMEAERKAISVGSAGHN